MAARSFSKTARSQLARQLAAPRVQQRTFVAAANLVRAGAVARPAAVAGPAQQQVRGVKTIDFAGVKEDVYGKFSITSIHPIPPIQFPRSWSFKMAG